MDNNRKTRTTLKDKFTRFIKLSLITKSLFILYLLANYIPYVLREDKSEEVIKVLNYILLYSTALLNNLTLMELVMPLWIFHHLVEIFSIILCLLWVPNIKIQYLKPLIIFSITNTIFNLVFSLSFAIYSQNLFLGAAAFLVTLIYQILSLIYFVCPLIMIAKRVIHYH
jgi:hypothetical protein